MNPRILGSLSQGKLEITPNVPQMKSLLMKTLIIDDEPYVRADLRRMLADHPEVEIIGEAATVPRALEMLEQKQPDVVFLDVQLIGGSGFDLVPAIRPPTQIVFFTAHDEYAVRAFEVNALDYLLKPVSSERLAETISRLLHRRRGAAAVPQPEKAFKRDDQVFIRNEREQRFVNLGEIAAVTSIGGNYTAVHMTDGTRSVVRRTLKQWETLLPDDLFYRVHRATIVNLHRIQCARRDSSGACTAIMAGIEEPLEVSRRCAARLKEMVDRQVQGGIGESD